MKVNGHIGYTSGFKSLYLNVFFFERLEISRSCNACKTSFERVFVQRLTFNQTDASAKVSIWEPPIPSEFDSPYKVRRRGIEIKSHRRHACGAIERWSSAQSILSTLFLSLRASMESYFPVTPQRFDGTLGEWAPWRDIRPYRIAPFCRTQLAP
jgi:hypothetical protein